VLDLAGLDEFLDGACDVFDWDVGVDPVLVEQVDGVDAEPGQRGVGDLLDVIRSAGETDHLAVVIERRSELGGDDNLTLEWRQSFADQLLVDEGAVDLGGVEEGNAAVHSGADQGEHLLPVGLVAVATGHAHAAQPDGGDLKAVRAQGALVHGSCSSRRRRCRPRGT
jgi:hypothetical protein